MHSKTVWYKIRMVQFAKSKAFEYSKRKIYLRLGIFYSLKYSNLHIQRKLF